MRTVLLGKGERGHYIEAIVNDEGVVERIYGYDLVSGDMTYDGNAYLDCDPGICDEATIGGKTYCRGDVLPEHIDHGLTDVEIEAYEGAYKGDLMYCWACGLGHDVNNINHREYTVVDDDVYCSGCLPAEAILVRVDDPEDIFRAKSIKGVDLAGYDEVDCLFCDNSGFGTSDERALTKEQAERRMAELMAKYDGDELFVGISDIGQFQVFVSVFMKVA